MEKAEERYDLFDAYILDRMNDEDKAAFEKRIAEDQQFAEEFEFFKQMISAINKEAEKKFKDNLREIDKKIDTPVLGKQNFFKYFAIAASIVILLGISAYFYFTSLSTNEKLYLAYYKNYTNDLVEHTRGTNNNVLLENLSAEENEKLTEAMKFYDEKNYTKTIDIIEDNFVSKSPNPAILFFLAVSQLEVGRLDEAIENLEFLNNITKHSYSEQTKWYLSLAYIKNKEYEKAMLLLKELEISGNKYKDNAVKLISDLKKLNK